MPNAAALFSGWSHYRHLTVEDQAIFDEAMCGFMGVDYIPVSVSSKDISGLNYRFSCKGVMSPTKVQWEAVIEIYHPINARPYVIGIDRL